ncbi:MAG: hypothetical protein V2I57_01600 [Xanthomonadales bacterium]|jgi:hypothetical protein|nr:hypothetical protein [Xanthomonadales bacterium]
MSKLRLTDWADVFGIVSAAAVVASLYYVAVELDDNTATHKARNQRELVDALQQLEYGWVQDEDLARIVYQAREGQPLEPVERYRVESLVYLYLNNWEQALHDYTHGVMEEEIWTALDNWLTDKARQPYFRQVVKQAMAGNSYSELFEEHLRDVVLPKVEAAGG